MEGKTPRCSPCTQPAPLLVARGHGDTGLHRDPRPPPPRPPPGVPRAPGVPMPAPAMAASPRLRGPSPGLAAAAPPEREVGLLLLLHPLQGGRAAVGAVGAAGAGQAAVPRPGARRGLLHLRQQLRRQAAERRHRRVGRPALRLQVVVAGRALQHARRGEAAGAEDPSPLGVAGSFSERHCKRAGESGVSDRAQGTKPAMLRVEDGGDAGGLGNHAELGRDGRGGGGRSSICSQLRSLHRAGSSRPGEPNRGTRARGGFGGSISGSIAERCRRGSGTSEGTGEGVWATSGTPASPPPAASPVRRWQRLHETLAPAVTPATTYSLVLEAQKA